MRRSGSPAPPQQWEAAVRHHLCGGGRVWVCGAGVTHLCVTDETLSADAGTLSLGDGARKQIDGRRRGGDGELEKDGGRGVNKRSRCRRVEALEPLISPADFALSPRGRAPQPQPDQPQHCCCCCFFLFFKCPHGGGGFYGPISIFPLLCAACFSTVTLP